MTDHVRTSYRRHRWTLWGLMVAIAVAAAAVMIPMASGARPTTYSFTGNASACAGTTSVTFPVVLTNTTNSSQNLGSANLYAPTNLTVTDASILSGGGGSASILEPIGTATLNGETRSLIHVSGLQLPGGQMPEAAVTIEVVANVSNPATQTKSWDSIAKQANDFNPGDTDLSNSLTLTPAGSNPTFTVAACELRFVTQPPNPWQKGTSAAVSAAVFAGSTAVPSGGLDPLLGATVGGTNTNASIQFSGLGAGSYSATTLRWNWTAAPNTNAASGLYNLVVSASGYTSVKSDSNSAVGNQEAPFRVTDNACLPGATCNVTSNLPGAQAQLGLTNPLPGSIAIDFGPGGTGALCDPWPNRAFFLDANGNPVYFPAVALDYTWGNNMLQTTYRVRNSQWVLTNAARGNQDIEFCVQARHQDAAKNDGDHPFVGKYELSDWDGTFYSGVLATVSNPNKVKTDGTGSPAVCARGSQDLPTGPGGASETWRTWTICIPFDWDWGIKPG